MTRRPLLTAAATLALATMAIPAHADTTITLTPSKDNTLYQPAFGGQVSNGSGSNLFIGATNGALARRAVLAFDIAGSVPSGATITAVTLTLNTNKGGGFSQTIEAHRLTSNWGEGDSNADFSSGGGAGTAPDTDDATWNYRFYPGVSWSTPGGDFSSTVSASGPDTSFGQFTIPSTPQFVADAQSFLTSPSSNFGWILLGNETVGGSAIRVDSRESSSTSLRPTLTLTFSTGPTHSPGDVNGDGFVNSGDINAFIFALSHDAAGFASQYPTGIYGNADVNGTNHAGDTFVNAADINPFIQILSGSGEPGIAAALAAVPEPASLAACGLALLPLLARRRRP